MEDSEFDFPDPESEFDAPEIRPTKRRRRVDAEAVTCSAVATCVFIVCAGHPSACSILRDMCASEGVGNTLMHVTGIIGIAFVHWFLDTMDAAHDERVARCLTTQTNRKRSRGHKVGYLRYNAAEYFPIDGDPNGLSAEELDDARLLYPSWRDQLQERTFSGLTATEHCNRRGIPLPAAHFALSYHHAELVQKALTSVLEVVSIGPRVVKAGILQGFPRVAAIKRWIKSLPSGASADTRQSCSDDPLDPILYQLPAGTPEFQSVRKLAGGLEPAKDAVKIIKQLRFRVT